MCHDVGLALRSHPVGNKAMRRFIFTFCIALLTFVLGIGAYLASEQIQTSEHSDDLSLRFVSETSVLRVDDYPNVKLYITNNGDKTVTLVHPGDGSTDGWRTPIVQWFIREAGDQKPHPAEPDLTPKFRMCGNINPLEWDDVFTLGPGETKELKAWFPSFRKPGNYRVQILYANRPSKPFGGLELGMHHPIAMWRLKHSTETTLISNEVVFTVTD